MTYVKIGFASVTVEDFVYLLVGFRFILKTAYLKYHFFEKLEKIFVLTLFMKINVH